MIANRWLANHPLVFGLACGYAFYIGLWIGAMVNELIKRGVQ